MPSSTQNLGHTRSNWVRPKIWESTGGHGGYPLTRVGFLRSEFGQRKSAVNRPWISPPKPPKGGSAGQNSPLWGARGAISTPPKDLVAVAKTSFVRFRKKPTLIRGIPPMPPCAFPNFGTHPFQSFYYICKTKRFAKMRTSSQQFSV